MQIELVPLLKDNYAYLLHDPATGATAVVDPSEAKPVLAVARARGWRITHVLSTCVMRQPRARAAARTGFASDGSTTAVASVAGSCNR